MARPARAWYVLKCKDGYLGKQWTVKQNTIIAPRFAVFPELKPPTYGVLTLCYGPDECCEQASRAKAILGLDFAPVKIRFQGAGEKNSRIIEADK